MRFVTSRATSKSLNPNRTVCHCAAVELGEGGIRTGGGGGRKDALIGRRGFVAPVCAQQNLLATTIPGPSTPTVVCLGYIVAPLLNLPDCRRLAAVDAAVGASPAPEPLTQ